MIYDINETPEKPVTSTPDMSETSKVPDTLQLEAPVVPQNGEKPAESRAAEPAKDLRQTGDKQDSNMGALGGAIVVGLLSLMAFFKPKKDEEK